MSISPESEIWTKRAPAWDLLDPSLQQFEAGFSREVIAARLRRQPGEILADSDWHARVLDFRTAVVELAHVA